MTDCETFEGGYCMVIDAVAPKSYCRRCKRVKLTSGTNTEHREGFRKFMRQFEDSGCCGGKRTT